PDEAAAHGLQRGHKERANQDLQGDKEDLEVSFWHKMLALQRIQLMDSLRSKADQNDNGSCLILETLNHIVLLGQKIIKSQKQVREKEQRLIDLKRKRLSLKRAAGQKLQRIQAIIQNQKNEEASMNLDKTKMNENFKKESELTAVIENVFQIIIIGSRINWAEDSSLKATLLQFEKKGQLQ
ncbi:CENPH protein, partial [Serilophus lunatus]|nr:CENPH protein [Serilophus lunatus]